jgi:putative flippase GtrA
MPTKRAMVKASMAQSAPERAAEPDAADPSTVAARSVDEGSIGEGTAEPIRHRLSRALTRRVESGVAGRMTRYLAGSVICTVISTLTFLVVFGAGLLGSRASSLLASAVGSVFGYWLNRNWTWGKRGVGHVGREMVPYWLTVVGTAVAAALVTGWVNGLVRGATTSHNVRAVADAAAYVGTYGLFFVVKYLIFDRLFSTGHREVATASAGGSRGRY